MGHLHYTERTQQTGLQIKIHQGHKPTQKLGVYKISLYCGKLHTRKTGITSPGFKNTSDTRLEKQQSAAAKHYAITKHSMSFDRT
jgi:hypothetical protein